MQGFKGDEFNVYRSIRFHRHTFSILIMVIL